ncbi:MAG: sugar-transfer associated ATP-grasp domain-containing protein [Christensenellales bacterium]|uniref:Alpha-L-glutamate ligase-related protein ATP-grasp domain-containing protein n=1 Tax=Candidatus Avichristensenella intestinipullorum TaxID=2840693 RepID=A0A9D0YX65_9FIRM|nr:sugar-transfer associated ATP-grasp domain-containing protein [Christensenellales bacterium]HIQ62505.1 hypothetical protein [Candidatus Avichristensenella intestinipullorum]
MGKIKYLLQRMRRMDYRAMWKTARMLHEKTGRATLGLLLDMGRCAFQYGAGYMDYKIAEMYRLTPAQRATQITRAASNRIVARMNDKAYWHFFDNKAEFNTLFAEQVRRDWLDLRDATQNDLDAWVAAHGDVIGKPLEGSSGQGIVKYSQGRIPPLQDIRAQGIDLLEPCVVQHPALAALCPTSVNTLRIATLLGDKKQGVVYAYIRIGNGGVVDNVDQGGMAAPIDLETGTISGVGADKKGNRFQTHPMTGAVIPGTPIPYWKEAVDMCLAASQVVPRVRFVAWDVAITPEGPVFIEGNSFPSHAIPQFAAHYPDGIGILPRFAEFIDL